MIRHVYPRNRARRGAILLVVLGMLALFAVVGLSFVLYAESEATGARNNRAARNELSDPDPAGAANGFITQLIFGTNDSFSGLYYQDLATSRFGPYGLMNQTPFNGNPLPVGTNPAWAGGPPIDQTQILNYSQAYLQSSAAFNPGSFNRAVPWTYPDRNNAYLAYYDPVTDQVTVPSFFRPDLFGSLSPLVNNPNWTNAQGRFMILRPRPQENPQFPTVPANADGTYTGDVANLKFLTGSQRNDSLWMDVNLPVKQWRGKSYKPLIAPLILDLGGKLNLTVAGNNKSVVGMQPAHGSHHGWGPWEMNPTAFFPNGQTDLQNLLALRYTGSPTSTPKPIIVVNQFTGTAIGSLNGGMTGSGQLPPQYSLIDASGAGNGSGNFDGMVLPAAMTFAAFPNYTSGRFAQSLSTGMPAPALTTQLQAVHGQSYSPYQWPRQTSLNTTTPTPYVPSLEDQLRMQLPFAGPKGASVLASQGINPSRKNSTLFSVSQRWGEVTVITGPNTTAKLTAIDLTRPLADYRRNTTIPSSPVNNYNPSVPADLPFYQAAHAARQNLARDIFVRLVATANPALIDGSNLAYNPSTGYLQSFNGTNYLPINAATLPAPTLTVLQIWAQYAANMVDQIDNDDISTAFVWNPTSASLTNSPNDPSADPSNFAVVAPDLLSYHVAFGTELPKLVLNEAYCMLNNTRQDRGLDANNPPTVGAKRPNRDYLLKQYWVELHNPLPADPNWVGKPEADAGAARLRYDPNKTTLPDPSNPANPPVPAPFASVVYTIEIADVAAGNPPQPYTTYLGANPHGLVNDNVNNPIMGLPLKIQLTDYTAWNAFSNTLPDMAMQMPASDSTNVILPANGSNGATPPATSPSYFVIGPRDQFPSNPQVTNNLNVADPAGPFGPPNPPTWPANSLSYSTGVRKPSGNPAGSPDATTNSVILLRRLVNPYLPAQTNPANANYNPYMTVDYLENVPTRDRARFDDQNDRGVAALSNASTIGRRHPYAAAPYYQSAIGSPAIVDQTPAMMIMNNPSHTFAGANSPLDNNNAITGGLAWLTQLDREPVNQFELLQTSMISPALLTQQFYDGTLYQKHYGIAAAGTQSLPPLLDVTNFPTAFRALDLLQVAPRLPGVPLGGREPGRVNINTVGDVSLIQAILDPQSGDTFAQNPAYTPLSVWTQLMSSRTSVNTLVGGASNQPIATVYEGGADRPFAPFGAINTTATTGVYSDSFLRTSPAPMAGVNPYPNLALFNTGAGTNGHPYMMSEPLRKGWNNLTTVSDGFLVVFTVGFFEVPVAGTVGKELFDKVPGDLRAQYAGIVDRSALTLPINPSTAMPGPLQIQTNTLGPKPWETKTVGDAAIGATTITVQAQIAAMATTCTVFSDGTPIPIAAGSTLWVGYSMANPTVGAVINTAAPATTPDGDGEAVTVTAVAPGPIPGTAMLSITTVAGAGFQRFHGGGSRVSNVVLGNPGPQPSFDYRDSSIPPKYSGVLPFFMRMLP